MGEGSKHCLDEWPVLTAGHHDSFSSSDIKAKAASKWDLIRPFFLILTLHSLAIYLFTRGFLLTRTELSSFSHCSDQFESPCSIHFPINDSSFSGDRPLNASDNSQCWTRPAVDRLVIIVLDALRFDFVAPSIFFEEKKPWMDKLEVLQKLASDEAMKARIFKAIADPPTTSLQRLKGLTTGGLPTFIDVGNSFGAPAIVEDNLIFQLANNGKRVLMMGDDTWVQLFPHHFNESYPYPSFNVKDLDTVDDGVIKHLLPSLLNDNWDVLIAHFLGMDHAGHIYGVDSTPMIQKLEQYNTILEEVVEVLKNQSGPGGLHENTLFIVMGDHGQTLNGDHGGGTAEEVETSLFALSLSNSSAPVASVLDNNYCHLDLDGNKICIGTFQQLDFSVTMASLLGIPFPFGSIGRVNLELYALIRRTWETCIKGDEKFGSHSQLESWMLNYVNNLCVNSWQVKRYIDLYSITSVIGLPAEDLRYINSLYSQAQGSWLDIMKLAFSFENGTHISIKDGAASVLQRQIDAYSRFLEAVAELARSAWTEFNLTLMGFGLSMMLTSIFIHLFFIGRVNAISKSYYPFPGSSTVSFTLITVIAFVAIRAVSFLSNSYILAEGRVASFLLGTSGILNLWLSFDTGEVAAENYLFLVLNILIRFGIESGMSKETLGSSFSIVRSFASNGIEKGWSLLISLLELLPIVVLWILVIFLYIITFRKSTSKILKLFFTMGNILSCMLMSVHWILESNMIAASAELVNFAKIFAPRIIYSIGLLLFVILAFSLTGNKKDMILASNPTEALAIVATGMLSAWSSTILVLLGRQGPYVALIFILGAWCITRLKRAAEVDDESATATGFIADPTPVLQWSLLAGCLFFYTGHWCSFDGLRYAAAFIGFEHFNIVQQGILLTIDTFGVSHIIPVLSLPFLVISKHQIYKKKQPAGLLFIYLTQAFLMYGLITAVTTALTIICVTIQRRHLMVWGLFAPKYVFDALGLLLTDALICVGSLFYY
ncbi:GPI ethanolamine phosphate transferase 3 [Phalaenopsis equestris]|uniref:GPI ethanolamine phosphate transferase 3 n=1 Tax=Phalaenopsis equestris TaxID=78828 RepID=UPI0009E300B9|nr:GPI ethanolamine phosphate transferase 3 [Phalaenopsis equestris]XP_020575149.1 GPI ethanolamine phosphate transferase 3 [Phalaenopsis equestris]